MKTTIATIFELPGAAPVLAAKIIGRVIDQVARGFGEDPQISDLVSVYKAIEAKYPKDTVSLPNMFKSMIRRASNEQEFDLSSQLEGLSEEQRAIWDESNDVTERQALINALPELTRLYTEATPNLDSWNDLPVIAQWSLLNRAEAALPGKIQLYSGWTTNPGNNSNAVRLLNEAQAAVEPMYEAITKFLSQKGVQKELQAAAEQGINVPTRMIAA